MCQNPQFPADLVTFTGEILNGKLHFCAVYSFAMQFKFCFYPEINLELTYMILRMSNNTRKTKVSH